MACRISELIIDARDPERLATFWCEVLGFVEFERIDGSIEIGPPEIGFGGLQPTIVLSPCAAAKAGKLPLHIDVSPGQTGDESWHVLADPEGNEFCLLRTRLRAS
jgi:hypothetical protein